MYAARNVCAFLRNEMRARLRHLLSRRNTESRNRTEPGGKKKRQKESVCATAFPRDRAEKEKPEIDMYSMPRRVQSIVGQAGGILSAV